MEKEEKSGIIKAYKERLDSAKDYERNLRSIVDIGHDMARSQDIEEIMKSMLELAVKVTGSQFACAALMGKNDEIFYSGGTAIKDPAEFPLDAAFSRDMGLSGLLMRTKEHYTCNITQGNEYIDDNIRTTHNIKNYISIPLLAKNRNFIGLLELYNKHAYEPFNESDADILLTLASFAAAAVERFRLYVELGKFGDEVQRIVDETLEAESALKDECGKLEGAKKELEKLKEGNKKAAAIAVEILDNEAKVMPGLKEKTEEILGLIKAKQ
jgi:GAF domain-containing protein